MILNIKPLLLKGFFLPLVEFSIPFELNKNKATNIQSNIKYSQKIFICGATL